MSFRCSSWWVPWVFFSFKIDLPLYFLRRAIWDWALCYDLLLFFIFVFFFHTYLYDLCILYWLMRIRIRKFNLETKYLGNNYCRRRFFYHLLKNPRPLLNQNCTLFSLLVYNFWNLNINFSLFLNTFKT